MRVFVKRPRTYQARQVPQDGFFDQELWGFLRYHGFRDVSWDTQSGRSTLTAKDTEGRETAQLVVAPGQWLVSMELRDPTSGEFKTPQLRVMSAEDFQREFVAWVEPVGTRHDYVHQHVALPPYSAVREQVEKRVAEDVRKLVERSFMSGGSPTQKVEQEED